MEAATTSSGRKYLPLAELSWKFTLKVARNGEPYKLLPESHLNPDPPKGKDKGLWVPTCLVRRGCSEFPDLNC